MILLHHRGTEFTEKRTNCWFLLSALPASLRHCVRKTISVHQRSSAVPVPFVDDSSSPQRHRVHGEENELLVPLFSPPASLRHCVRKTISVHLRSSAVPFPFVAGEVIRRVLAADYADYADSRRFQSVDDSSSPQRHRVHREENELLVPLFSPSLRPCGTA